AKRPYPALASTLQPIRVARRDLLRHHHRRVNFRIEEQHRPSEPLRRDADDGEVVAVELDPLTHQVRIASKATLPTAVAHHSDRIRAGGAVFFLSEHPAFEGAYAEQVEVIARSQIAPDALVDAVLTETHRLRDICRQPVEDIILVAEIFVDGIGESPDVRALEQRSDFDDPLR